MEINGVANPIHQLGRRQGDGGNDNKHPPPLFNCPRCESENTKFCYYNNYSLTQPRYYCKSCRRYWTQGGTLRNVPVGGGSRKSKRGPIRPPIPSGLSARPQPVAPVVRAPIPLNVVPPTTLAAPNFTGGSFMSSMTTMQPLPVNGGGGGNGGHFNGSLGSQMAVRQFNRPPTYFPQGSGSWNQGFGHSNISTETSVGTSMSWSNAGGFIGNDNAGSSFSQN